MAAYCMAMPDAPGAVPYAQVQAQPRYPSLEEQILAFWREDRTFEASVAMHAAETEYVFYDGPPFANGLPHYGHLLTGFVKDAVPRYQTMRGPPRRAPLRLGLPRPARRDRGREGARRLRPRRRSPSTASTVSTTTAAPRCCATPRPGSATSPARRAGSTSSTTTRRWTSPSWRASCGPSSRARTDKGLIYEGYRVLPYCWECETPLSNFETRQDDAYRDRIDPAVTVAFDASSRRRRHLSSSPATVSLLVWTTTPWTLPSNLALAVGAGPHLRAARPARRPDRIVLAEATVADVRRRARRRRAASARCTGADARRPQLPPALPLLRRRAECLPRARRRTSSPPRRAPGIVHMAPGFGEDDQRVCEAAGIAVVCPVDDRADFDREVPDFAGLQVFEANAADHRALRAAGALLRSRSTTHSYPHCWRTDTPLIYRAVLVLLRRGHGDQGPPARLTTSRSTGCPSTCGTAPSASGSRGRATGRSRGTASGATPIPVWKSDDPALPANRRLRLLDELAADFGVAADRPAPPRHRRASSRPNPDDPTGKSTMRRVTDVLDCWFESGSMPFAQLHYPFENTTWFEEHFPADFICEYVGQTRGWFYTLHVLGDGAVRPAAVQDLPRARHRARRRRPQALQAAAQLPRSRGVLRATPAPTRCAGTCSPRRCFAASTSSIEDEGDGRADPARAATRSGTAGTSFASTPTPTSIGGTVRTDQTRRARPLHPGQDRRARRGGDGGDGRLRPLRARRPTITRYLDALTNWYVRRSRDRFWRRRLPFGAQAPAPGSAAPTGRGQARRLRHLAHRARGALPGRRAASPVSRRGGLSAAHRRAERAPRLVARSPTSSRPTPSSSRRWISSARSAPPATRSARPAACGHGCRFAA